VKQISTQIFNEMKKLGWIKFGIADRNVGISGKYKKSKARTYYVLDSLVDDYELYLKKSKEISS
jgi:hypothetical protein